MYIANVTLMAHFMQMLISLIICEQYFFYQGRRSNDKYNWISEIYLSRR